MADADVSLVAVQRPYRATGFSARAPLALAAWSLSIGWTERCGIRPVES